VIPELDSGERTIRVMRVLPRGKAYNRWTRRWRPSGRRCQGATSQGGENPAPRRYRGMGIGGYGARQLCGRGTPGRV